MSQPHYHWQPIVPSQFASTRAGETRIGESITTLADLNASAAPLGRFAILGVPESIGPRANLGQGGAELGFQAFLQQFLNMQDSQVLPVHEVVLAGQVDCQDLNDEATTLDASDANDLQRLRQLCEQLDQRVAQVTQCLFKQGYEVILIGGGHNNALPLLQSLAYVHNTAVGAVNLDPHADFRPLEGRHSGNGFSYAYQQGYLKHYHVMALHPAKNSAATLQQLQDAGATYSGVHDMLGSSFAQHLQPLQQRVASWQCSMGIELDVDAIQYAPASALNYTGVALSDALLFVQELAKAPQCCYLHLAEAAPACHPLGVQAGIKATGQILSELVFTYIVSRVKNNAR
ncbi:formimidoylglutamase [Aliidiomarina sp.]|uniref:formimidoylglutamase n=1 Tax=Aliidiomarina sp. TaxID=1872439 RepID=UPI003A4E3EC2